MTGINKTTDAVTLTYDPWGNVRGEEGPTWERWRVEGGGWRVRRSGAVCFRRLDRVSEFKRNRHVQTTLTTFVRIGCSRGGMVQLVFAITMVLSRHRRAVWMDCLRGHQSTASHLGGGPPPGRLSQALEGEVHERGAEELELLGVERLGEDVAHVVLGGD